MTENSKPWIPTRVTIPSNPLCEFPLFDWDDHKIQRWKENAIKMQEAHVMDNNKTKWFVYKANERDLLELRLMIWTFGIPQIEGKNGIPSSLFRMYKHEQRIHAKMIKKKIWKYAKDGQIFINVIYISTACFTVKDELLASEIPVFVIDNESSYIYVDTEGNIYESFKEYKEKNTLPQGPMIYPKNGHYVPNCAELEAANTPKCSVGERVIKVIENTKETVGIVVKACSVVMCFSESKLIVWAAKAVQYASYLCMGMSAVKCGYQLYSAHSSGKSITLDWIHTIAYIMTVSAHLFLEGMDGYYINKINEGVEISEVSNFAKDLYASLKLLSMIGSTVSTVTSFINIIRKKNRSSDDYFQLIVSLFVFANFWASPKTIEDLFKREQANAINKTIESLDSDKVKAETEKLVGEEIPIDKIAAIREVRTMDNLMNHLEKIGQKVSNVIKQSAGGQIGKKVGNVIKQKISGLIGKERTEQILSILNPASTNGMNAYIYKNRTYFIDLSLDIVERTYNRGLSLEEWEEQKEKLESQLKEEKINQQEFDTRMVKINERIENAREIREFYNKAQEGLEQAIHTISSTVKNYANPFAGEQQPPGNAQNNTDSSVAREQPPKTAQDNTTYSTPEERYVNCILQETFETNDLSTIQVNGESIFVNLQIQQCARLHRVLDNQKEKYKELLEGAVQLANNQNFAGSRDVTSSYHIGILIEIIIIQTKNMSEYEEHTFFRQLLSGEGDQQNKLVTVLNQIKELVEWLQNGEATLALYNRVKEWSRNEANLKDFKKTTWPSPSARDHNWRKVINAAKSIQSDDFVEREALEKILEEFFKEPKYEIGQGNIQIVKRTVFLSELVPKIRGDLKPDSIVKIFAGDCCNIDTSVEWRGINLAIVTNKVNVWKEVKIDVSGKDQKSEKTKANSSLNINCSGESGRDGKPGESSGNITIFAKHFVNPELLTIIANGGRGQDGQDGGDGCAGKDGIGVTRKEIEKMLKNLNKNFKEFNYHKNFCPPGWIEKKVNSVDKEYVRKKFEDNHGRVMLYSYGIFSQGGFLFWNSYTYDFYLLINGTDGTRGSSGGENGVGGEGGYAGKVIVKDLDTDVNFPVKIISEQGKSGDNGEVGKSGKIGINGNHMGMTTCQSSNWYFYGDKTKQRLKLSHHYKREKKNRYNGYLKLKKKKNACFITFTTEEIDQTFRRTNATTKVTTRTEASRAVSKANVLSKEILAEATKSFEAENTFLTDTFKDITLDEDKVDEEEEEQITEEVTVIKNREPGSNLDTFIPENDKFRRQDNADTFIEYVKNPKLDITLSQLFKIYSKYFNLEFTFLQDASVSQQIFKYMPKFIELSEIGNSTINEEIQSTDINEQLPQETKEFFKNVQQRKELKKNMAEYRRKVKGYLQEFENYDEDPNIVLNKESESLRRIKKIKLSGLTEYSASKKVEEELLQFFGLYANLYVDSELFDEILEFQKLMQDEQQDLVQEFEKFRNDNVCWYEPQSYEKHLEEFNVYGLAILEPDNENLTELQIVFRDLVSISSEKKESLDRAIAPLRTAIELDEELKFRFGEIPSFKRKEESTEEVRNTESNFENHLEETNNITTEYAYNVVEFIKFWFFLGSITKFNFILTNIIALENEYSIAKDNIECVSILKSKKFDSNIFEIENRMKEKGLASAGFRYLIHKLHSFSIMTYKTTSFQTITRIENYEGEEAGETAMIWVEGDQVYGIEADKEFRKLEDSEDHCIKKYSLLIDGAISKLPENDFKDPQNQRLFASFFSEDFHQPIIETLESYMVLTEDNKLINVLYYRFYLDGCHLSHLELQFIIESAALLIGYYNVPFNWILLQTFVIPQNNIFDRFFYIRLYYFNQKKITNEEIRKEIGKEIGKGIGKEIGKEILTISSQLKALFAVKLHDYLIARNEPISEDILYKLILMLQQATGEIDQLTKCSLAEWMNIAEKQTVIKIKPSKGYESIEYYFELLSAKGLKEEEELLRKTMDKLKVIPGKFVGQITNFIINKEVTADTGYFEKVEKFLIQLENHQDYRESDRIIVTKEKDQNELLNWLKSQCETGKLFDEIFPKGDRTPNELENLTVWLHDAANNPAKKQKVSENCKLIESDEKLSHYKKGILYTLKSLSTEKNIFSKNKNYERLEMYNQTLYTIKGIHLRTTQKLAIICALETESHLLEQVNTGEGKSYIIAGIACIRCMTGCKSIDIITSSPVLARRDAENLKEIYSKMGVTVAHNCDEDLESRKKAYSANVVYGDMARFQRDYLLHTFYKKNILGNRTRETVIVDEVDNMMLDNGNNMLYLSHNVPGMNLLDSLLIFVQEQVFAPIYSGEKMAADTLKEKFDSQKIKQFVLEDIFGMFTEEDLARIAPRLSKDQLVRLHEKLIENQVVDSESYLEIYKEDQLKKIDRAWPDISENIRNIVKSCFLIIFQRNRRIELPNYLRPFVKLHLDKLIENCKTAFFMKPNTEYVIDVDRTGAISSCEPLVTIIDGNTGADLPISQWSEGLHQFLQLKHGCRISAISLKAVFISNVTYLKGYEKINGLSGTLGSTHESRTLVDLYNADLIKVPTAKPKFFCEYVPIIVIKKDEWIKSIYNEIEDQVSVGRSVLIICENIEQLHIIVLGLKNNFNAEKNLSEELKKCFETLFIYEREHDTFEFESVLLEVGRLIVATNLAGRGTDIKLSDELITNGGLHVITAFLPRNCRIEEQAFGRAGRCGNPGSARIIGLQTEYENTHMKCSVFMHKIFRDNNEIIRLDKLKEYYEFHINIEEQCLEKFRAHCEQVLSAVASQTKAADFLPTLQQIQYFSLLDQWAIWLDSVNPQIEKCSKQGDAGASMEKRIEIKNRIINSTDEFIKKYPIEKNRCCPKWLATPQALLSIGVNFVRHEDGLKEADNIFDRVIKEEPGFAAEAHYYKGIIRTVNFSDTIPQKLTEYKFNKAPFLSNLEEVREHLLKSRALFLLRIQRKEQEAKIAGQLVVKDGLQVIEISGFLEQHKAIIKYLYLMVQNIDYLLGTPCEPKMFMQREITEEQSKEIYKSFVLQGIISPNLIIDSTREKWQLDAIQKKYRLSYNEIHRIFNKIKKDLMRTSYDNLLVLDQNVLSNKASLSTRGEFWAQMEYMGALDNSEVILIVNRKINEELPEFFKGIQKVDIYVEQQTPFFIRFSNSTSIEDEIYYFKDVNEIIKNNEKWNDEVNRLINCGFLKLDTIAMLNVLTLKRLGYFEKFDGVTTEDLMEYFGIEKSSAKSILHLLVEEGILEYQSFPMKKIDEKHEIWKKIKEFITYEAEEEKKMNSQLDGEEQTPNSITKKKENPLRDPFKQHCYSLFELKDNEEIINFTSSVVSRYCGISIDSEEETLFYKYLEEERIIIPYNYWIYRQVSRIDLRSLPQCISLQLDEFFSDRFAFTFALDGILHAINKSIQGEPTCLQIFLPEDPLVDFEKDLVNYGFVMDARIFTKDAECIDYEDIGNEELMRKIIETNRCKLHDQTDYHLRLKPFGAHALEEGFVLDTDMRNMIDNGMLVVLSLNTEKDAWSLTSQIFKAGMKVFNAVKSVIKVIGNFCGKVINTTGKIIQETIKTVGRAINATSAFIRETAERFFPEFVEFYDATINAVSTAGMKVLQGAEWVTRKAMQGINWVEENIVDPIQTGLITGIKWVSDKTRLTDLLKAVVAKVQYIFGKISRFCTALMESYEYYNQLRTATRRTALEQRIGINEHTILRAYHENKFEQRKKDEKLDKTNKKIEIDLIKFRTSLWTICDQLIKINPKNMDNKVSTKLVLDVFENGRSMKFFKSEFKDQLIFSAWLFQSEFYAYMDSENFNYTFKGLSPEILQHPIENFFDELNDFVSDDDNKSEAQDITENWLNVFHEQLKTLINDMIESTCIEPSSKVLYDLASNREILTFVKHNEDDETLKEAINNDVSESMNQSKILFLRKELVSLFSDRIISYADANKEFLKHAIKYGYPLPLKVMKTVADIIEIVVTESFSYGAGFKLIVNSEENKVIDYSTKPSAVKEVHLEAYNGYIYLCQRDFQENTGLTEAKDEKQLPFFYEAYVRCLKDISHKFVKKEETMRQMILEKL